MTNISTLGQALDQISRIKAQQSLFDDLSVQLTTGKKTQKFSGLGSDILESKRARAGIRSIDTYLDNIMKSSRRMKMMVSSMEEIQNQAKIVMNALSNSMQQGEYSNLDTVKTIAGNAYNFLLDLINSKDGDRYIFAGADTDNKPITDNGLFENFLGEFVPDEADLSAPPLVSSGAIGDWGDGTITTTQFIDSYHAVSETVLGYSNTLVNDIAGKNFVRVDEDSEFEFTMLGNHDAMKKLVIAFGVLKDLPPPEYAPGALNNPTVNTIAEDTPPHPPVAKQNNFFRVINDLRAMMKSASDAMSTEIQRIAMVDSHANQIKERHVIEKGILQDVVGEIEDVDANEVAVKIKQLELQIQTSYRVTAMISELSLTNFV